MAPRFEAVPLPKFDGPSSIGSLEDAVDAWVGGTACEELIGMFGGPSRPPGQRLLSRLVALDEFSDRWDFRGGRERNLADSSHFAEEHEEIILDAARALGLVESPPPRFAEYDHMVVLGGLVRACVLRPRLAHSLIADGLQVSTLTGVGAFRPLGGNEWDLAKASGIDGIQNEFEAMEAGFRNAFAPTTLVRESGESFPDDPNLSWLNRVYETDVGVEASIVAAPSSDPTRRANTPDAYRYWAEALEHLAPGQTVLLVTSAIYVPFQHVHAIRMLGLPYGAIVDTVGVDARQAREPELQQTFTASQYLQEIRSTIRSMRTLVAMLDEVEKGLE